MDLVGDDVHDLREVNIDADASWHSGGVDDPIAGVFADQYLVSEGQLQCHGLVEDQRV